ncbi:hypothetical protein BH09BAC4_BH09BAC4_46470 [soil metagenome]
MDKKTTTSLGIALGAATLLAGAGFGIYKYFKNKSGQGVSTNTSGTSADEYAQPSDYIGNGLIKSIKLYGRNRVDNGLVGGGLYTAS